MLQNSIVCNIRAEILKSALERVERIFRLQGLTMPQIIKSAILGENQ